MERKDPPHDKTINKTIKEYFERMINQRKALQGFSGDEDIDCPNCNSYRTIRHKSMNGRFGRWEQCFKCKFEFPANLTPPGPQELKKFLERIDEKRRMDRIAAQFRELELSV